MNPRRSPRRGLGHHLRPSPSSQRRPEGGFTLIELLVAVLILGIIIVPIATALIMGLRTVDAANGRLAATNDATLLAEYFPADIHSVTIDGFKNDDFCAPASGVDQVFVTFGWGTLDTWANGHENHQTRVTYAARGRGADSELVRFTCYGESAPVETVVAGAFGSGSALAGSYISIACASYLASSDDRSCYAAIDGTYSFRVDAETRVRTNETGRIPPDPPHKPDVFPGNSKIQVRWDRPSTPEASLITSYNIYVYPYGNTWDGATLTPYPDPVSVPANGGVTFLVPVDVKHNGASSNGFPVQVSVSACIAGTGCGATSELSDPVTPAPQVPDPPSIVSATAGNTTATVRVVNNDDGGSPITKYRVRVLNDDNTAVEKTVSGSNIPVDVTFTGLTNGQAYQFEAAAQNQVYPDQYSGWSDPGPAAPGVTPCGPPDQAPRELLAFDSSDGHGVALSFVEPTRTPDICEGTAWLVKWTGDESGQMQIDRTPPDTNGLSKGEVPFADFGSTNLVQGHTYSFTVAMVNQYGTGPDSEATPLQTVKGAPAPPTILSMYLEDNPNGPAEPGLPVEHNRIRILVGPPTNDGGYPVTDYQATCTASPADDPSTVLNTVTTTKVTTQLLEAFPPDANPPTVPSLGWKYNGYTFHCKAVVYNSQGVSAPSAESTDSVQPLGRPSGYPGNGPVVSNGAGGLVVTVRGVDYLEDFGTPSVDKAEPLRLRVYYERNGSGQLVLAYDQPYDYTSNLDVTIPNLDANIPYGVFTQLVNKYGAGPIRGVGVFRTQQVCTAVPQKSQWVSENAPSTVQTLNNFLAIRGTIGARRRSFMQFDVSGCFDPAKVSAGKYGFVSNRFEMQQNTADSGSVLQFYVPSRGWDESTMTWNNQPWDTGTPRFQLTTNGSVSQRFGITNAPGIVDDIFLWADNPSLYGGIGWGIGVTPETSASTPTVQPVSTRAGVYGPSLSITYYER